MKIFLSLFFMISMLNAGHSALGLHEVAALDRAASSGCICNFLEDGRGGSCVADTDYQGQKHCVTACRSFTKAYRCGLLSMSDDCRDAHFMRAIAVDKKCSKLE